MAAFFLLLAVLVGVVLVDAMLENTTTATLTLFDRGFDQLSTGELMVVFAGLGFLLALFLFMAFGSSRTRRTRRKEKRSARRDAEGRVEELERENAHLRQELSRTERVERLQEEPAARPEGERAGATAIDERPTAPPPRPTAARRERVDDRGEPIAPPRDRPPASGTADDDARRR
jgi:type II secretory pathway pseudopilin PulG